VDSAKCPYLGVGVYTISEAAQLIHVPSRRVHRWIKKNPLWAPDLLKMHDQDLLTFLDMIELRFVDAFRRHKVSMRTIRAAYENAKRIFDSNHPFSLKKFKTDGYQIFVETVDDNGKESLLEIIKSQYAFGKILNDFLEDVDFLDRDTPQLWWPLFPNKEIVIDPTRRFGQPIVSEFGIQTESIFDLFLAEGRRVDMVADWYNVSNQAVLAAVNFEEQWKRKIAA